MIKVFLVEDEFVVREGIKKNIDWAGHGYDFCGEAGDGELAFPLIQKLRPDVVITDIRMPFMDGLELSRLIKKEFPWMEIIILSGFEEFEYAKQAIKIGVAQYLTKPIKGDALLSEVDALSEKIEERRREKAIKEKYRLEMEENTLKDKLSLFHDLVTGESSLPKLMEAAEKLSVDLTAVNYSILLLSLQSQDHKREEYSTSILEAEKALLDFQPDYHFVLFDRNLEGKALLFKADSESEIAKLQNAFVCDFESMMQNYDHITYFGGIGKCVNRLSELPESFESANRAFSHRFFINESKIMDANDLTVTNVTGEADFDISMVDPKQIDKSRLINFLKMGNSDESVYFVDEFINDMGEKSMESLMFRQYIAMDCYFAVSAFLEEIECDRTEITPPDMNTDILAGSENTAEYILNIITSAINSREEKSTTRYSELVQEVLNYIGANYADEELSLNSLASHVNVSPNHLSMIFSQQTGQAFIKYLTDYRMNKAKELLKCTSKRGSEIAQEVGYKDPHYFSYIFKKTQGMTPTQYREG